MGITAAWYVDNRCERKQTDPKLTHTRRSSLSAAANVCPCPGRPYAVPTHMSHDTLAHAPANKRRNKETIFKRVREMSGRRREAVWTCLMCSCLQQRQMEATSIRQNPGEAHAGSTRSFSCPHEDVRPAVCPHQTWRTELEDTGGHQNSSFNGENLRSDLLSRPTLDSYLGPSCSSCGIPRIPALALPAESGCPHNIWKLCSSSSSSQRRA